MTPADLELPDHAGRPYRVRDRLATGRAVALVFYRGDW
jgi:hypothetical protein